MEKNKLLTSKGIIAIAISFLIIAILDLYFLLNQLISQHITVFAFSVIIFFILIITMFYGISYMLKGKNEFNTDHKKSVSFGGNLIIFGILLYLFGKMFIIPSFSEYPFLKSAIQTIIGIPFLLGLVYMIKELTDKIIRNLLWTGFFLNIILNFLIQWVFYSKYHENMIINNSIYFITLVFLSIIPALIFVFVYYKTYLKIITDS